MAAPTVLTHPIARFVVRRLAYSAVVLLGVAVVVFALVHLVPGDPVRIAGDADAAAGGAVAAPTQDDARPAANGADSDS